MDLDLAAESLLKHLSFWEGTTSLPEVGSYTAVLS